MQRRTALATFATLALSGAVTPGLAQTKEISATDLAVPGPLGDIILGSPDAKVMIYEYASLTCGHCAEFHEKTFPELKKKYIDTGKVRFVLREYPLDGLAAAGFMLARCAGDTRYYAVVDLLFSKQRDWALSSKPVDAMADLMKQAGFTQEKFESCLKDQKTYDGVMAVRDRGDKIFGVRATPTFYVNGKLVSGAQTIVEFDQILAPLVGG